jgi:ligand-binding sensor domain-containing protein
MWFGTDYGLAMHDGNTLVVFTTFNSPIPENHIRSVYPNPDGSVWIGGLEHGAYRFDGSSVFEHYHTANSAITDNTVEAVVIDTLNRIYFGTTGGLNRLDGSVWEHWDQFNSILWSNHIRCLHVDTATNFVYAGNINGGIVAMRDTLAVYISYLYTNFPDNTVLDIVSDDLGTLWCSTPSNGLFQFYPEAEAWVGFSEANSSIPENSCLGLLFSGTTLYSGSQSTGLIKKTGTVFSNYSTAQGIPDVRVNTISQDLSGKLWLGTEYAGIFVAPEAELGVNAISGAENPVYTVVCRSGDLLPKDVVFSDIYSASGQLVYHFNVNTDNRIVPVLPAGLFLANSPSGIRIRLLISP